MESVSEFLVQYGWSALTAILTAAGGGGIVAWLIFKKFGEQWLDSHFKKGLEEQKHEQTKELERLKSEINTMLDRRLKLQQREFEVLQEVWAKLNDAYRGGYSAAARMISHADLDRMTETEFQEYLDESKLTNWQKRELNTSRNRNNLLDRYMTADILNQASQDYREYHFFLRKNGIFLPDDLCNKLIDFGNLINAVISEQTVDLQHPNAGLENKSTMKFLKDSGKELEALETEIRTRLASGSSLQ